MNTKAWMAMMLAIVIKTKGNTSIVSLTLKATDLGIITQHSVDSIEANF